MGLPRWLSGKESACQCRRHRRCGFDPWVGKIPWSRKWQPTLVFLPGESYGQRSLVGYNPWGLRAGHDWSNWACVHAASKKWNCPSDENSLSDCWAHRSASWGKMKNTWYVGNRLFSSFPEWSLSGLREDCLWTCFMLMSSTSSISSSSATPVALKQPTEWTCWEWRFV